MHAYIPKINKHIPKIPHIRDKNILFVIDFDAKRKKIKIIYLYNTLIGRN